MTMALRSSKCRLLRLVAIGALSCAFVRPARADRPQCPWDSLEVRADEARAKEQSLRIECEDSEAAACHATMILRVRSPGPNLTLPDTVRKRFPADWTWTSLSADGKESESPATSVVVGFVARGPISFGTERRSGFESIPEGCPGGRRTAAIFLRHPWTAVRSDRVTHLPIVADSFEVFAPNGTSSWGYDVGGAKIVAEENVGSPLRLGGPFVAVGVSGVVDDDPKTTGALKLRAGYEIARPSWLVHSVAAESSIARGEVRDFVLVPMTEAALATGWFTDGALGFGVPIRIDDPTVGLRFQFGLHFPVVGLVVSFDKYFGRHVVGDKVMNAFLQLSF